MTDWDEEIEARRAMEISPEQLRQEMSSANPPLVLDVRKPWEYDYCHIEGTTLVPLDMLPLKVEELDRGRRIVAVCHAGIRSLMAADYLRELGFEAFSLEGGLDLWSARVDPSLPRY